MTTSAYVLYGPEAKSKCVAPWQVLPSAPTEMQSAACGMHDPLPACALTWLHLTLGPNIHTVWLMSSDVHCQGEWIPTLAVADPLTTVDLLATSVAREHASNAQWYHWQFPLMRTTSTTELPAVRAKCFAAAMRVSRRLLECVAQEYCSVNRWYASTVEVYLPTLCIQRGMEMANLPPAMIGRFDALKDSTLAELNADPAAQSKLHFRVTTPTCACAASCENSVNATPIAFGRMVSVGPLCAAAHQMRRAGLRREAYPFDWAEGGLDTVMHTIQHPDAWTVFETRSCIKEGGLAPPPFNAQSRTLRYKLLHANGYEDEGKEGEPFTVTGHDTFLRRIGRWKALFEQDDGVKTLFVAFAGTELGDSDVPMARQLLQTIRSRRPGSALLLVTMGMFAHASATIRCVDVSQVQKAEDVDDFFYHYRLDMAGGWMENAANIEGAWAKHIWPRFTLHSPEPPMIAVPPPRIARRRPTTAYVLRTRKVLANVEASLKRDLNNVWVLFDAPENEPGPSSSVSDANMVVSTTEACRKVNPLHRHELASESGLALLHSALPSHVQHVWVLSQALRASGSWAKAFACAARGKDDIDFLATAVDEYDGARNGSWYWWHQACVGQVPPVENRRKCFFAVVRFSRRLLAALASEHEWSAHQEMYLPTFAHLHGFSIADIHSESLGDRFTWDRAIDPAEFQHGGVHLPPDKFWHPVK